MLKLCSDITIDGRYFETYNFQPKNVSYSLRNQYLHKAKRKISFLLPNLFLRRNVFLKRFYYRINTKQDNKKNDEESEYLTLLEAEFHSYNQRLASEMNIDLKLWEWP